jgi:predicted dehydrogenase
MTFGLCVVGCSEYTQIVMGNFLDLPGKIDIFFASRDLEKSKKYAQKYNAAGYFGNYETAARDNRVNAMYFLTPHDVHLENVKLAATYQKDILLEKPIARTLIEGQQILKITQDANIKCMIAENFQFMPVNVAAKKIVQSGRLGKIRQVDLYCVIRSNFEEWTWRNDIKRSGGGRFIDGGIHYVNLLINLMGLPSTVFALSAINSIPTLEGEDSLTMLCKNNDGVIGSIHYSNYSPVSGVRQKVSVRGTQAELTFEPGSSSLVIRELETKEYIELPVGGRGTRETINEFLECVISDKDIEMTCEKGLEDLSVVMAAYDSNTSSKEVDVPNITVL